MVSTQAQRKLKLMLEDWSYYELEAKRYLAKAKADLEASQCMGSHAAKLALVQADTHLSLAISELVTMREALRRGQRVVGAF